MHTCLQWCTDFALICFYALLPPSAETDPNGVILTVRNKMVLFLTSLPAFSNKGTFLGTPPGIQNIKNSGTIIYHVTANNLSKLCVLLMYAHHECISMNEQSNTVNIGLQSTIFFAQNWPLHLMCCACLSSSLDNPHLGHVHITKNIKQVIKTSNAIHAWEAQPCLWDPEWCSS